MAIGKTASGPRRARDGKAPRSPKKIAPRERNRAQRPFAVLLVFSGAAALIYQVLWIKQLSLVVGAEVYAVTVAVSAFFTGLALGGAYFGRWGDRLSHPLRAYAALEAGIAAFGTASTMLLAHGAAPFARLEDRAGLLAWVLPFLLVGLPAFLMGGTLPVAIRGWARGHAQLPAAGGNIYAANTAGGIAGALLSTFLLLPALGVHGTSYAAAGLNLAAAAVAFLLSKGLPEAAGVTTAPGQKRPAEALFAMALYTLAGAIALGYEVVWSQAIVQFVSTRSFAFSIVLATYLAGLAVGSALYARFAHRFRDPWQTFGILISAAGLIAVLEFAALDLWQLRIQAELGNLVFSVTGSELTRMSARFLIAALGIVFLPTVLLGAAFPAALRLTTGEEEIGRDIGELLALNTIGGVLGTLLTGFLLVPAFGLVRTQAILAAGAAAIGAAAVLRRPAVAPRRQQWIVLAIGIASIAIGVFTPTDRLGRLLPTTRGGGSLAFYKESRGATVAVVNQRNHASAFRRLYIQGTSNSGDAVPSLRYMRLQALLPLLIHTGEPRSALVIGFGTGITAGALLQYPSLQTRVCAELLPAVVEAGPLFLGNFHAASDPRLQIRLRDGRRELLRNPQRYDLITLEPPPPSAAGVANLYSTDFYRLATQRLETNGLLAQWLPLTTQNDADTRSLVRSFLDVFPYATLWTTELHEMLLVGSLSPIRLDADQVAARFQQPAVASALGEVGVQSPAALLATWVMDRASLGRYAADAPPVTDDRPRIEYAAWVRPDALQQTLPELLDMRTQPPVIGADPALQSELQQEQRSLYSFYAAGIAAYNGDREAWTQNISAALENHQENPYYRGFLGDAQ